MIIGIILAVYLDIELPKGFDYLDGLPVMQKQECIVAHLLKCDCITVLDIQNNRIYSVTVYKKIVLFIYEERSNGSIELYPERKFII